MLKKCMKRKRWWELTPERRRWLWDMFTSHGEAKRCTYCWKFPTLLNQLTVDHVVPLYYGGSNAADNLVPCCDKCNKAKGKLTLAEFCTAAGLDLKTVRNRIVAYTDAAQAGACR